MIGGQVRTHTIVDRPVDVGAEALHLGAPGVAQLLADLGLDGRAIRPSHANTLLWTARGIRHLPAGVGPAGPSRLAPVLRSRVLTARGLGRAALEPLVPRGTVRADESVAELVSRRFGTEVTEQLVDPLLGGLHAGDVSRLSVRSATPQLAALSDRHRSLVLARRGRSAGGAPELVTFPSGMSELVRALVAHPGVEVRTSAPVHEVVRRADGYRLRLADGTHADACAVAVAAPAHAAKRMLAPLLGDARRELDHLRAATVASVVVTFDPSDVADTAVAGATGLLVPSSTARTLKSATFLGSKWPHLAHPDHFLVRLSAGRAGEGTIDELDDAELLDRLLVDLAEATGLASAPLTAQVERWNRALAQLEVGHSERMQAVADALSSDPRVVTVGSAYDGIGVATCLRAGERAGAELHGRLAARCRPPTAAVGHR